MHSGTTEESVKLRQVPRSGTEWPLRLLHGFLIRRRVLEVGARKSRRGFLLTRVIARDCAIGFDDAPESVFGVVSAAERRMQRRLMGKRAAA